MDDDVLYRAKARITGGLIRSFDALTRTLLKGLGTVLAALERAGRMAADGAVTALAKTMDAGELCICAPLVRRMVREAFQDIAFLIADRVTRLILRLHTALVGTLKALKGLTWEGLLGANMRRYPRESAVGA